MHYFYCPFYQRVVMPARAVTIEQLQPLIGQQVVVNYGNIASYVGKLTEVDAAAKNFRILYYENGQYVIHIFDLKNTVSVVPLFGGGGFGTPGSGFGGMDGGGLDGGAFGGFGV